MSKGSVRKWEAQPKAVNANFQRHRNLHPGVRLDGLMPANQAAGARGVAARQLCQRSVRQAGTSGLDQRAGHVAG